MSSIVSESMNNAEIHENVSTLEGSFEYIPEKEREIFIDKMEMSIFELHRRYQRGELNLRPFYQRRDVWTRSKKSKVIESVLRSIPIPAIYFAETEDENFEVIDGQQRLSTFFDFMEDSFRLQKVPALTSINGRRFSELIPRFQRKIEDYQLYIFIVKKESHPDIKFDIFQRINEGAVKLNAQELRNCIYRGEGINLVKELACLETFRCTVGSKLQYSRGKDEEAVLRFLSFYVKGYENYNGNINAFLNDTLRSFQLYKDKLTGIKNIFDDTMRTVNIVFGDSAFIKDGTQRGKISLSLFDIITVSFARGDRAKIIARKDSINKMMEEFRNDRVFLGALTSSTLTVNSVRARFRKWYDIMEVVYDRKI
jgi:hypothetical protein